MTVELTHRKLPTALSVIRIKKPTIAQAALQIQCPSRSPVLYCHAYSNIHYILATAIFIHPHNMPVH
jgi:hypothetical protein